MIPYIEVSPIDLGAIQLQPYGALFLLGAGMFALVAWLRARELQLSTEILFVGEVVVLASALFGAHLYAAALYYPWRLAADPMHVLQLTQGLAVHGAILFGALGGLLYLHLRRVPKLPYMEAFTFGALAYLVIGRVGCALVHDHPGTESTFVGAVTGWPDGSTRHDLGLYELVILMPLTGAMVALRHRRAIPGLLVAVPMLVYALARFGLDFLRVLDARYAGLTPGHYASLVLFTAGIVLLIHGVSARSSPPPR